MADIIDFYFEFSSPYGYLASNRIEELAQETGRELRWHPILLGPMFKAMGSAPLIEIPLKGQYALRDFKRSALLAGIPYTQPDPFPIATVAAARAALYALGSHPESAAALIKALYRTYFVDNRRIDRPDVVLEVIKENGLDPAEFEAAIGSDAIKAALKAEVDEAMARGVFGSPFIIVDDEPFWGFDRLDHVRQWLRLRHPAGEPARHG
jgi:2-hydroxychromene-2-carboxylate isomerase